MVFKLLSEHRNVAFEISEFVKRLLLLVLCDVQLLSFLLDFFRHPWRRLVVDEVWNLTVEVQREHLLLHGLGKRVSSLLLFQLALHSLELVLKLVELS